MSDSPNFVEGMYFKDPSPQAPDFVKGKLSINVASFVPWFEAYAKGKEWINMDIKISKGGKAYIAIDDWKPTQQGAPAAGQNSTDFDTDAPF